MTVASQMLETYPKDLGGVDRDKLRECIEACVECAQACTACADACLSEDMVAELTKCIRTNLDCADVCDATGRVLSRHTGYDANLTRAVLEACAAACKACGDECGGTPPCTSTAGCVRSPAVVANKPAWSSSPHWADPPPHRRSCSPCQERRHQFLRAWPSRGPNSRTESSMASPAEHDPRRRMTGTTAAATR